jgi:glyceraldehyde-3-phosphate dehydrogenase (ferredoxin)
VNHEELNRWIDFFDLDKHAAAYEFWYEIHKGIHESLREFPD